MTTIYFIRHAEPDFTIHEDRIRPLNSEGRLDCALVTEFLQDKNISAVLSSPYKRAFDTVAPFANSAGLQEVQERNIAALEKVLIQHKNKNIVIGTHGTALSTIINYYDKTYGYENFKAIAGIFPWVVKMEFDDNGCMGMEKINLFQPVLKPDYKQCEVRTAPLGTMKAYKYNVIFVRYNDKWLYTRHKDRDVFETAGGHIEAGETLLEAAKRELFEETGAVKYDIEPAFDYSVHFPNVYANGQVFFAQVYELGDMPNFEMAEVALFDTIPDKMRFPQILPVLYGHLQEWLKQKEINRR